MAIPVNPNKVHFTPPNQLKPSEQNYYNGDNEKAEELEQKIKRIAEAIIEDETLADDYTEELEEYTEEFTDYMDEHEGDY